MTEAQPASLGSLRAVYFVHFTAFGVFLPFFPPWLEAQGHRGLAAGALLAIVPALSVVAPPALGALADAVGLRGQLLRAASLLAAGAFAAAAYAGSGSGAVLALAMVVYALARAPLFGIVDVLALEALGERSAHFGKLRVFGSLGFLVTAVGFGLVASASSGNALPLIIAGLYVATFVVTLFLPTRAPRLPRIRLAELGFVAKDARFFLAILLWQVGNTAYDVCYTLHARDAGHSDRFIGALWGLGVVGEVLLMAFGTRLFSAFRPRTLLAVGMACAAARWALIGEARSALALALLQPLHALSFALTWLAATLRLPRLAQGGRLATVQGILAGTVGLASVLGSLVFLDLYARGGGRVVFVSAGAIAALGSLVALGLRTFPPPSAAR